MNASTSVVRSFRYGVSQGLSLDHYSFRFTSMTSLYSSKHHHQQQQQQQLQQQQQQKSKQTLKCPLILIGTPQTVNEVDNHNVVGVTIDCNLSSSSHLTALCKVFPRKCTSYIKLNSFWSFMPANYFFMPIFSPSSTTDRHCGLSKSKYS